MLVTGDDNGKVTLFRYPCSNPNALGRVSKGHSSHVTNVRFLYNDKHVVSTGGGDRCVFQWKLVDSKTVRKPRKLEKSLVSVECADEKSDNSCWKRRNGKKKHIFFIIIIIIEIIIIIFQIIIIFIINFK